MESKEYSRRDKLDRLRGRQLYESSNSSKKQCPRCLSFQSYDEVIEKRKKCVNCNLEYKPLKTWAVVEKQFIHRMEQQDNKKKVYI